MNVIEKAPNELLARAYQWCPELDSLPNPIIAGGFIREFYDNMSEPSDMDLYFRERKWFERCSSMLQQLHYRLIVETENAVTLENPINQRQVQPIKLQFGDPQEIISKFDYIMCMGALDVLSKRVFYHEDFLDHIKNKRLVYNYNALGHPMSSFKRAMKFASRGYKMNDKNLLLLSRNIADCGTSFIDHLIEEKGSSISDYE